MGIISSCLTCFRGKSKEKAAGYEKVHTNAADGVGGGGQQNDWDEFKDFDDNWDKESQVAVVVDTSSSSSSETSNDKHGHSHSPTTAVAVEMVKHVEAPKRQMSPPVPPPSNSLSSVPQPGPSINIQSNFATSSSVVAPLPTIPNPNPPFPSLSPVPSTGNSIQSSLQSVAKQPIRAAPIVDVVKPADVPSEPAVDFFGSLGMAPTVQTAKRAKTKAQVFAQSVPSQPAQAQPPSNRFNVESLLGDEDETAGAMGWDGGDDSLNLDMDLDVNEKQPNAGRNSKDKRAKRDPKPKRKGIVVSVAE